MSTRMKRADRALDAYNRKRRFSATAEPRGRTAARNGYAFVVQKHAARRLHYDLRLELDGVMKSWAVTRGPSLVPGDRRLAVQVEDHPVDYARFEGTIPQGEYGGGTVMIWDRGRWEPQGDPHRGLAEGSLSFRLHGEKLRGGWHLVRMRRRDSGKRKLWLLIKQRDAEARAARDKDILAELPLSVQSGRGMAQIAAAAQSPKAASPRHKRSAARAPSRRGAGRQADPSVSVAGVILTHPDRVYWRDGPVRKRDLADYYATVWKWMKPHVAGRPLAVLRCPEGSTGPCFFQKHAKTGLAADRLHLVPEKDDEIFAVDRLEGMIALVQAGVLEIHVRGSTIADLGRADRLVFDLDPGPGVGWDAVVAAAREVRLRLEDLRLTSFVKATGGKGLHVVVPIRPAPWNAVSTFARALAAAMEKDDPRRYVASAARTHRTGRIFIDYLRNGRDATAIAPYSTRARPGAPVAVPLAWSELAALAGASHYTMSGTLRRLARLRADPWADMTRTRQALPNAT